MAETTITIGVAGNLTLRQMQRVAQKNGLETHATYGQKQDMSGLTVTLSDLCAEDSTSRYGWSHWIGQLEGLASKAGVVIKHPGHKSAVATFNVPPGEWTMSSYFTYPGDKNKRSQSG